MATLGVRLSPTMPRSPETEMMGSVTGQLLSDKMSGQHRFDNIGRCRPFRRDQSVLYTLYFWNQPADFPSLPAGVAQELQFGNDVEGLIDLPVKEVIDRLTGEYPGAMERAG